MTLYSKLVRDVFRAAVAVATGELAQLRYLREFERSQFLPPEEIRQLQWRRLQILLEQAYGQCPFYRERFERAGLKPSDLRGLEDLRALPALEKRDIQEQGDGMVAQNWPRADLIRQSDRRLDRNAGGVLSEQGAEVFAGGGDAAAQPLGRLGGRR